MFDCFFYQLIISNRNAYGFSSPALRLIHAYLSNKKQETRIGNWYSTWFRIMIGLPWGSILEPLLCNIFLAELYFIPNEVNITNFSGGNKPYTTTKSTDTLIV